MTEEQKQRHFTNLLEKHASEKRRFWSWLLTYTRLKGNK